MNKKLEKRYFKKKKAMALECKGQNNVNEAYVWHVSDYDKYDIIMRDGLRVGGVDDGININQGKIHGFGIYTATTPDTPIQYASDSKWSLACLGLKGNKSNKPIEDKKK